MTFNGIPDQVNETAQMFKLSKGGVCYLFILLRDILSIGVQLLNPYVFKRLKSKTNNFLQSPDITFPSSTEKEE